MLVYSGLGLPFFLSQVLEGPLISKLDRWFEMDLTNVDINLDIDCNRNDDRPGCTGEGIGLNFRYSSQTTNNTLVLKVLDSGEVQVKPMIDTLDFLMSWMIGSQLGAISSSSSQVMLALTQFLSAMVRICAPSSCHPCAASADSASHRCARRHHS